MRRITITSLGLVAILAAACTSAGSSVAPSAASPSAVAVVSAAPSVAPSATPDACAKASLTLVTPGKFTIGTDNPAYPPYFAENADKHTTPPWEIGDPTNGQGFESAVGYAIADQLGFDKADVTWIVVPFANSFAPGPKTFDIDLNQVNYKTERTQTADLTKGYYFGNQALVVLKDSPLAKATTIAELKDYVYGAQVGTTGYDANDLAIKALGNKTIDGVMVDLPTADYITNVQVENATIVGQFEGGTPEYFSAVLGKGSTLTPCVDAAIDSLTADGTLDKLASTWLPFQDSVPVIKP